jgi:hypothetical protein
VPVWYGATGHRAGGVKREAVGLESLMTGEVRPYESDWTSAMIIHRRNDEERR